MLSSMDPDACLLSWNAANGTFMSWVPGIVYIMFDCWFVLCFERGWVLDSCPCSVYPPYTLPQSCFSGNGCLQFMIDSPPRDKVWVASLIVFLVSLPWVHSNTVRESAQLMLGSYKGPFAFFRFPKYLFYQDSDGVLRYAFPPSQNSSRVVSK